MVIQTTALFPVGALNSCGLAEQVSISPRDAARPPGLRRMVALTRRCDAHGIRLLNEGGAD